MCLFLTLCNQHKICGEKKCKDEVSQRKATRGINQNKSIPRILCPEELVGIIPGGQKTRLMKPIRWYGNISWPKPHQAKTEAAHS